MLRVLLGLYRRTQGTVFVLGLDPATRPAGVTRQVAYVPGEVALWPSLSGQEVLDAMAGIRGAYDPAMEKRLVADFALDTHRKIRTYSKGNRQKVLLVAAFAARTDLLVLDAPTSGLDPLMEELFQRCVQDVAAEGRTVLLSSHLLHEVERVCGAVTIIKDGKLVETGQVAQMRHLAACCMALTFLLMAMASVVAAQLVPTAWSARVTGALVLAGGFAVRAAADTRHHPWLNWVTPLGLRATVQPFTANRPLPLVVALFVVILLALVAMALERSRELGGSIVRVSTSRVRRRGGPDVSGEAFRQVIGQWSAVLVLVGPVVLLAGWTPRLAWMGWIPCAVGCVLALLGTLLGVPPAVIDLGPFNLGSGVLTPLCRVAIFGLTAVLGLWAIRRRDLTLG